MRLSVYAHVFSVALKAAVERARLTGFEGVVIDPLVFPVVTDPSRTAQREIIHTISRAGQALVGIDVRLSASGFSPERRAGGDVDREIDRVGRAIDIARGLQCSLVLCDLGPLPPAPDEPPMPSLATITKLALGPLILPDPPAAPPPSAPAMPRDPAFESALEHGLRVIGERADRAGCMLAFRATLGSFASLQAALTKVDCPFFGIDLDPLALLADAWSIDTVFSRLGRLMRHVHARDGVRGVNGRVVVAELGAGNVQWPELIAALRDSDYRGPITVDPADLPGRPAEAAQRGIDKLRGWLA